MKRIIKSDIPVIYDLLIRYYRFHAGKNADELKTWGLLHWGEISSSLKRGLIETKYTKLNKVCWYYPSESALNNIINPLINKMDKIGHAGLDVYSSEFEGIIIGYIKNCYDKKDKY